MRSCLIDKGIVKVKDDERGEKEVKDDKSFMKKTEIKDVEWEVKNDKVIKPRLRNYIYMKRQKKELQAKREEP